MKHECLLPSTPTTSSIKVLGNLYELFITYLLTYPEFVKIFSPEMSNWSTDTDERKEFCVVTGPLSNHFYTLGQSTVTPTPFLIEG